VAPEHLRVEVTSAIRGRWLAGKLTDERADAAVRTLNRLAIRYASWDELAARVWELRRNVTPYDAAYLALAEARGCRLVTTDGKLRDCPGLRCEVRVVASAR
jgi:predicted nucleic acid-binding protein